jgi:hypothetical protein
VNHRLDVISNESELEKDWKAAIDFCGTLQCEIVSSSITIKTRNSPPSGSIAMRVSPPDFEKLVGYIEKHGSVVRHTTESEDKTTAVIDTDAKIKNLTSFRDNLRTMLAKPSATVQDFVEIQQQLTDVQSQLDSETAQRKILANETEKIAVEIAYKVDGPSAGSPEGMAAIGNAIRESGNVLAESIASLITMVVAVIPWLILIVPLCWFLARVWRRVRRRRLQRMAESAVKL